MVHNHSDLPNRIIAPRALPDPRRVVLKASVRILAAALLLAPGDISGAPASEEARRLVEDGLWKQARLLLEPKLKADPSDAEAAALLSRVRLAYGDLESAVEFAETAVRLMPKVAEYHFVLGRVCGEQAKRASLLKRPGLVKRFRQECEAAIALDARQIPARLYLISYYAGAPAIAGGDKDQAERLAAEVAGIDAAWGQIARARILEESESATDKPAALRLGSLYQKAADAATTPEARVEAWSSLLALHLIPVAQDLSLAE